MSLKDKSNNELIDMLVDAEETYANALGRKKADRAWDRIQKIRKELESRRKD